MACNANCKLCQLAERADFALRSGSVTAMRGIINELLIELCNSLELASMCRQEMGEILEWVSK